MTSKSFHLFIKKCERVGAMKLLSGNLFGKPTDLSIQKLEFYSHTISLDLRSMGLCSSKKTHCRILKERFPNSCCSQKPRSHSNWSVPQLSYSFSDLDFPSMIYITFYFQMGLASLCDQLNMYAESVCKGGKPRLYIEFCCTAIWTSSWSRYQSICKNYDDGKGCYAKRVYNYLKCARFQEFLCCFWSSYNSFTKDAAQHVRTFSRKPYVQWKSLLEDGWKKR